MISTGKSTDPIEHVLVGQQQPEPAYVCVDCKRTFQRAQGLGKHRAAAHGIKGTWQDRRKSPSPKTPRAKLDAPMLQKLAEDFALARLEDPISSAKEIMRETMRKSLPPDTKIKRAVPVTGTLAVMIKANFATLIQSVTVEVPVIMPIDKPVDVAAILEKVSVTDLFTMAGRRLGQIIDEAPGRAAEGQGSTALRTELPGIHVTTEAPRVRLPTVGIVGINKEQFENLRRIAPGGLDLVFIEGERSAKGIPQSAEWLVSGKFARHGWYNTGCEKLGHDRVFFCGGGLSNIRDTLQEILVKTKAV